MYGATIRWERDAPQYSACGVAETCTNQRQKAENGDESPLRQVAQSIVTFQDYVRIAGEPEVNRGAPGFRVACHSGGDFVTYSRQVRDSFSWRQAPRRARDGAA